MADKIQMKTLSLRWMATEMTRIIWKMIKDILLTPYIDLKLSIMILVLSTERQQTTKLHSILHMPPKIWCSC